MNYLVTLQAMKAAGWIVCRVPVALPVVNERPHNAPRQDSANQQRYVDEIRTYHTDTNICCREIKVEPDSMQHNHVTLHSLLSKCQTKK